LSNCDWAKLTVQLRELEIAVQIKDLLGSLSGDINSLSYQEGVALNDLRNAVEYGNSINSGGYGDVLGALDGILGAIGSIGGEPGEGEGGCVGNGCLDSAGGFGAADTSGFGGKANYLIGGGGRGFSPYTDQQIGSLIPIPSGGQCPVIEGDIGIGGITRHVSFDFNSLVPGSPVNVALFIKTVLLITVYFINVFTMISIFRSGGRK
jgi:hypothetical protein